MLSGEKGKDQQEVSHTPIGGVTRERKNLKPQRNFHPPKKNVESRTRPPQKQGGQVPLTKNAKREGRKRSDDAKRLQHLKKNLEPPGRTAMGEVENSSSSKLVGK